jgi:citrate lyase synthetase
MEPSETPTRELTLDEAVELAILLQQQNELIAAGELLRRVLECTMPGCSRTSRVAATKRSG